MAACGARLTVTAGPLSCRIHRESGWSGGYFPPSLGILVRKCVPGFFENKVGLPFTKAVLGIVDNPGPGVEASRHRDQTLTPSLVQIAVRIDIDFQFRSEIRDRHT